MKEFKVIISANQAANEVENYFGGRVDKYRIQTEKGNIFVLVFQQYFLRIRGCASLTVTVSDISGETIVRAVGSGVVQSFSQVDFGVSKKYENNVTKALLKFIC